MRVLVVAALIALVSPPPLRAQIRVAHGDSAPAPAAVPAGQRPPAGMCRVWLNGVPAGNQPAPTTCANAVKVRASHSHVIFGATTGTTGPAQPVRVTHVMTPPANAIVPAPSPPPPSAKVAVVKPPKPSPSPPPPKPPRLSTPHR